VAPHRVGKRQVEALTVRAAADVDGFYAQRRPDPALDTTALAMSAGAKGVVMRPEALRAPTAKARTSQKLATRLSAGKKRNRKRDGRGCERLRLRPRGADCR
jgi:hypothetical protein